MRTNTAKQYKRITIFIFIFDGFNILDVSGPSQVFTQANEAQSNQSARYEVVIISETGGLIQSNSGLSLDSIRMMPELGIGKGNTFLIAGGSGIERALQDASLINQINTLMRADTRHASNNKSKSKNMRNRIGSVCTGAFLLAMTGALRNRKAVTHWRYIEAFKRQFPEVLVDQDPIYINDDGLWTSAGITAGIDLALAMVAEDAGQAASLETARELVVYLKRSGGQSQFSTPLYNQTHDSENRFDQLHHWVYQHLHEDLSVDRLADRMNMSQRTFFRLYKHCFGITPAKNIEKIRIDATINHLENTAHNISSIARECGFSNENHLRRTFVNHFGITPTEYRSRFSPD